MSRTLVPHDAPKKFAPTKSRQRILKAAFKVFSNKGYEGASFGDIARAARVQKTLVQYHFKSKEALFLACAQERLHPMAAALDQVLEIGPSGFLDLLSTRVALLHEYPEIARFAAWASMTPTPTPLVISQRRERLLQKVPGQFASSDFISLLFGLALADGWFLYRNLYRRIFGEKVFEKGIEEKLMEHLKLLLQTQSLSSERGDAL